MSEAHLALMMKLEELDAYTHTVLHQFPKLERHLLCAEMRTAMNKIMRLTVVAWKRRQKSGALFGLDVEIEVFRGFIRKAHRMGYINTNRLEVWMRHANEIGKMVGAWIKHEGSAM
jgi:hypothetical protein